MNKLSREDRSRILHLLCEGNSIRAVTRITGASKNTVSKLLVEAGHACLAYHDKHVRNLKSERVQVDEIWTFTYAKAKNVAHAKAAPEGAGDTWTWTAIDADSKLMISWLVADRTTTSAFMFLRDLKDRLANRVQLSSDGHRSYLSAVKGTFNEEVDYAQIVKLYGNAPGHGEERRYSPATCIGATRDAYIGNPDEAHINTSFAERQNLNMRMHMRRFTRLTNAFSKKLENHALSVALFTTYYNFVRIHKTLRVTPAMAAGITDKLWEIGDIVEVLERWEFDQSQSQRVTVRDGEPEALPKVTR